MKATVRSGRDVADEFHLTAAKHRSRRAQTARPWHNRGDRLKSPLVSSMQNLHICWPYQRIVMHCGSSYC